MTDKEHSFTDGVTGSAVTVKVIPRAAKDEITGVQDDGIIKMRVTTQRGDASANPTVIRLLSKQFKVPEDRFEIVAGHSATQKLVSVEGLSVNDIQRLLGLD